MKTYHSNFDHAIELKDKETTKAGIEYNPKESVWKLVQTTMYWGKLELYFDAQLIEYAKISMVKLLKKLSVATAGASFRFLLKFAETNFENESELLSHLTEAHVRIYRERCMNRVGWHESDVRGLQSLLNHWYKMKLPGLDPQIIPWLKSISIKHSPSGVNIRAQNPNKGIYSDMEIQRIDTAFADGFAKGKMSLEEHVLCLLVRLYGQRPSQYRDLKIKDFKRQDHDGQNRLCLDIPMGKGRGSLAISLRNEFLPTKVMPKNFEGIIIAYVYQIIRNYRRLLQEGKISQKIESAELPLFPGWFREKYEPGFIYHSTSNFLTEKIKKIISKQGVMSDVGEKLTINPTRFRHTIATGYCVAGYSDWWIGAAMGWRNTRSISSYREISALMVKKMTRDDAIALAPLFQAFNGTLKLKGADEKPGSVKSHDLDIDHGNCSYNSFCGAIIPFACYTCDFFEPWDDVDIHSEFLAHLLIKRNGKLETDYNGNIGLARNRIPLVNDLTIIACAEVVRACMNERKKQ